MIRLWTYFSGKNTHKKRRLCRGLLAVAACVWGVLGSGASAQAESALWEQQILQSPPSAVRVQQAQAVLPQEEAAPPLQDPAPVFSEPSAPVAKPKEWAANGEQTCLKCHDTVTDRSVMVTAHGAKGDPNSAMANHACESCHGASPEHNTAKVPKGQKRPPTDVVFKGEFTSSVEKRNAVCADCHNGEAHINWQGSAHQTNDVACTNCHTAHATSDPVLNKKKQPEICFTCHTQERAETYQFSHHPIREGKVSCSDCHNSHGSSGESLLKETTLNETCYACHAEQRGPFLWEHEPVREDCSICHTPHGSTQDNLLKQREPFLCQSCHQGGHRGHDGLISGGNQLPGGSGMASYNMLLARGCENCHSKVHGSNSPSGNGLSR